MEPLYGIIFVISLKELESAHQQDRMHQDHLSDKKVYPHFCINVGVFGVIE